MAFTEVLSTIVTRTAGTVRRNRYAGYGFTPEYEEHLHKTEEKLRQQYGTVPAVAMMQRFLLMYREFPKLGEKVHFDVVANNRNAAALAFFSGDIQLAPISINSYVNERFMGEQKENKKEYRHIWESYMAHELGHILEVLLIEKRFPCGKTVPQEIRNARVRQWTRRVQATRIVAKACDRVRKQHTLSRNLTNNELVAQVSDYATTNRSEALAECVMDYSGNRAFAHPLSIAVWDLLKEELCEEE